jgi:hypothetical protein
LIVDFNADLTLEHDCGSAFFPFSPKPSDQIEHAPTGYEYSGIRCNSSGAAGRRRSKAFARKV